MFPRTSAFQSTDPSLTSTGISGASGESAQDGTDADSPLPSSIIAGSSLKPVGQFFGPTSFLSAFDDGSNTHTSQQRLETPISTDTSHLEIDAGFYIRPSLFPLASKVLTQFPDDKTCLMLFDRYKNINDEIIRPTIVRVMRTFWSLYGKELKQGKASSIRKIAALISRNTSIALENDEDGLERWMKSSSPQMIRWEGIGIILSHLSYGIISSGGEDLFLVEQEGSEKDREKIVKEMRECVANCIKLCREYSGNTLLAYLIYKHLILEGIVNGDTSKPFYLQRSNLSCQLLYAIHAHLD